jgi:hypothetical protein
MLTVSSATVICPAVRLLAKLRVTVPVMPSM